MVRSVSRERPFPSVPAVLFLGRCELHGWREREIIMVHMQGRLATGTYLSSALPQYIPATLNPSMF